MGERTYRAACALYRLFSRKMNVEWAEPFQKGPCVFVVNNAGVAGALDMMVRFPERTGSIHGSSRKCWKNGSIRSRPRS